ncbi:uncharacterized protein F5Z01DRAFT_637927 [Emericellopsis atlantica]|uniref:Cytidyltransferase-like domain-containing protein n=1 Tax=Emericellopsis atlantica TaxID=2614577 RepID=A0A9P7ZIS2_9HYPO|nr:uncharacterized protein F5Z01DRAFT_637927 [Emericellopsis atlantica]KAG9252760.1 hypothetical protein F5Z01DRAFT_637927 [Emericellopsis atlantica]
MATPPKSRSLLVLASPPSPAERSAIRAALHDSISASLTQLTPGSSLVVAIAAPFLPPDWSRLQSLLAKLYSLVAIIQAGHDNPADVNVLLVDHAPGREYARDRSSPDNDSCIVDLGDLASLPVKWSRIFHASTEASIAALQTFLGVHERSQVILQDQIIAVPGGVSMMEGQKPAFGSRRFSRVIIGGTFDHFHLGHKLLLQASTLLLSIPSSAQSPAMFTIGITGDALLKNKRYASEIEPWSVRAQAVTDFVGSLLLETPSVVSSSTTELITSLVGGRLHVRCTEILDAYGPTTRERDLDALVVSGETRSGGKAVNDKRRETGWHELEVFEIDVLHATEQEEGSIDDNYAAKISSTDYRRRQAEARSREKPV